MKFLTCLYFANVNITGELLQYFMCNCPLLEALSVMKSCHLVSLVVPGTALQLKCLEIFWCPLESFVIGAPNLVSLKFSSHTAALRIGNMSKLVDVTLAGEKPEPPLDKLRMFSSYHHQLEFLKLTIKPLGQVNVESFKHHHFSNLKHLILHIDRCDHDDLLGWLSLIEASPFLQKFTLELQMVYDGRTTMKNAAIIPHQCLKVVEVVGFEGKEGELELVTYLIESSIKLEKLVIDRRKATLLTYGWKFEESSKTQAAKQCQAASLQASSWC